MPKKRNNANNNKYAKYQPKVAATSIAFVAKTASDSEEVQIWDIHNKNMEEATKKMLNSANIKLQPISDNFVEYHMETRSPEVVVDVDVNLEQSLQEANFPREIYGTQSLELVRSPIAQRYSEEYYDQMTVSMEIEEKQNQERQQIQATKDEILNEQEKQRQQVELTAKELEEARVRGLESAKEAQKQLDDAQNELSQSLIGRIISEEERAAPPKSFKMTPDVDPMTSSYVSVPRDSYPSSSYNDNKAKILQEFEDEYKVIDNNKTGPTDNKMEESFIDMGSVKQTNASEKPAASVNAPAATNAAGWSYVQQSCNVQ